MKQQNTRGRKPEQARRNPPPNQRSAHALMDQPQKLPLPLAAQLLPRLSNCRNTGLLFDRYVCYQEDWQLETFKDGKKSESAKYWNLKRIEQSPQIGQEMLAAYCERWKHTVAQQGANPFSLIPEWRFITGLGNKTALDVGFTFYRIYGFPILPGSGLKGLTRTVAFWEIAERLGVKMWGLSKIVEVLKNDKTAKTPLQHLEAYLLANDPKVTNPEMRKKLDKNEEEAKQTLSSVVTDVRLPDQHNDLIRQFRHVFGTPYAEGRAVFFDAIPAEPPKLEADVMNVHYEEYYREAYDDRRKPPKTPPADYSKLNPIPFLTVGRTPFLFAMGWHGKDEDGAHQKAVKWLRQGLTNLGAGAKTSAGYGYFMEVN